MVRSQAHVSTPRPERYAKQLVSHLGVKMPTAAEGAGTRITFQQGSSLIIPGDGELVLMAYAESTDDLAFVQDVVARHLVRFGEKDGLSVEWHPSEEPAPER